jgi:hypothetical protein
MYRIPLLVCLAAFVLLQPPHTQAIYPYPPPAPVTVNFWYQRFLHREAEPAAGAWSHSLAIGHPPEVVLASILSGPEYFRNAGGTPAGFINALYIDLTGAAPLPQQMRYWLRRSQFTSRRDIAYDLLLLYPQAWHVPASYYSY